MGLPLQKNAIGLTITDDVKYLSKKKIMSVISKENHKITVYYHSGTSIGEQTHAYVQASQKKLLAIDIAKTNITGTQWAELAEGLGIKIADLVNQDLPAFREKYGKDKIDLDGHDWMRVLEKEPQLLRYPVIINGQEYVQIESAADFKKYIEPDSAGLEKHTLDKQFTDEDTP
jgi:arsenate reductase-like glutaredoxin family protein